MSPRPTTDPELILHPIRVRIVYAVEGRTMTAGQIAREVPDVPPATLYRHIKKLQRAGVLVVKEERRVRGAVERYFVVEPAAVIVDPHKLVAQRKRGREYFEIFLSCQRRAYAAYTAQGRFDLKRDGARFSSAFAYLTDAEQIALNAGIQKLITAVQKNRPDARRRRRTLSYIALPETEARA